MKRWNMGLGIAAALCVLAAGVGNANAYHMAAGKRLYVYRDRAHHVVLRWGHLPAVGGWWTTCSMPNPKITAVRVTSREIDFTVLVCSRTRHMGIAR